MTCGFKQFVRNIKFHPCVYLPSLTRIVRPFGEPSMVFGDLFHSNIFWLLGDGNDANVWHDVWVPSLGSLNNCVKSSDMMQCAPLFADF
ncbi:hypothetical protein V6N12_003322 [Hibiscus sabdariffa]|uniref:Uncharacterized protein n=1 Tax=Hibiscus sabdariffa TaxID=183260 RepID=A0ABR2EC08_9ROSI